MGLDRGQHGGTRHPLRRRFVLQHLLRQQLQPLNSIAGAAPRVGGHLSQHGGLWPGPSQPQIGAQRVKPQPHVSRQRPQQRRIPGRVPPWRPGQRDGQITPLHPGRRLAEDVQPIADLRLFQITQIGVQPGQAGIIGAGHPGIGCQPAGLRQADNLGPQMRCAARVKSRCLVIFIHQRLKIAQRAIGFGAGQGRGQVVNNHRLRTAFRLCPLAGVINDERIQMRHRPQRNFRPASIAQRHSLARQPFQIAVFSHMDNRIRPPMFAQPDVEGQIGVRRDQVGGMVGFGRVDVIAARRLQADDRVAKAVDRQGKTGGRISDQKRISIGGTPAGGDLRFHLPWQGVEVLQIGGQRQHLTALPVCPVGQPVGRPGHQPVHQRLRIGGKGVNLIPRPGQQV